MVQYVGYKKMKITEEHLAAVRKLEDARDYFEGLLYQTREVKSWWGLKTRVVPKYHNYTVVTMEYKRYMEVSNMWGSEIILFEDYVKDAIKYVPTNVGEEIEVALEYAKVLDELLEDYLEGRLGI